VVSSPRFAPKDGKTFCNLAVDAICSALGYVKFHGLTANEIVDALCSNGDWTACDETGAAVSAKMGRLAVAALKGEPHGHVAVVYPGPTVFSGKWKRYVPKVANVGAKNGVMGANWAFKDPPGYYLLVKDVRGSA